MSELTGPGGRSTNITVLSAETIFKSEAAKAKRMGFTLKISKGRIGVGARLTPATIKTSRQCAAIGSRGFESTCIVPVGGNEIDALRETIRCVLERAKDELA